MVKIINEMFKCLSTFVTFIPQVFNRFYLLFNVAKHTVCVKTPFTIGLVFVGSTRMFVEFAWKFIFFTFGTYHI